MAVKSTITYLKPCKLAVVSAVGPYRVSENNAWTEMFEWLDRRQHHEPNGMGFGLSYDATAGAKDGLGKYIAGVKVPKTWKDRDWDSMQQHDFTGGAYMIREKAATYDDMAGVIAEVKNQWIPRKGVYWDRTRPVVSIYRHDPRSTPYVLQQADVCLPVSTERRSKIRAA